VKEIEEKFKNKKWKTLNDDNAYIPEDFLHREISLITPPSIYSKKDVIRWFSDYKIKFNLDENYQNRFTETSD
jgi:hypothetical protein